MKTRTTRSGSRSIYETIKNQIGSGIYLPGASLVSSRTLAAELGVARSTVTIAYEQLAAEGYLEVLQGSRPKVPKGFRLPAHQPRPSKETSTDDQQAISDFGKRLSAWQPWKPRPNLRVDFRYGNIAGSDFPRKAWKHAFNAAMRFVEKQESFTYIDSRGLLSLRTALQGYLWRARGIRCDSDQIVVVNGSQQGLDICARLFINTGDRVVVEEPAYSLARVIFSTYGATIAPVAVDADGMQTNGLETFGGARLGYITPSHQFPLGGVLPTARRQQLLEWSSANGVYLIEDDYDGEFRFDIKPIEPLYSLDTNRRVIYLGTLSKTLSPQLRLGYLVVPPQLVEVFARAKKLTDWHSPILEQGALTELITNGAYERHVRQIRRRNGQRREQLLTQLTRLLGDQITVVGSSAGLHVVVWFNYIPWTREQELIDQAEKYGVGLYGIGPLYHTTELRLAKQVAGAVFGYAALSSVQIEEGCIRLQQTLSHFS